MVGLRSDIAPDFIEYFEVCRGMSLGQFHCPSVHCADRFSSADGIVVLWFVIRARLVGTALCQGLYQRPQQGDPGLMSGKESVVT